MESLERVARPLASLVSETQARPALLASLPQNSIEYAHAAAEAGADAVLVGVDKTDTSLPGLFGSFDLTEDSIGAILSTSSVPVGISIGDSRPLTRASWERMVSKPFSFVQMLAHQMPLFILSDPRIGKLVSVGPGYMLEQVKSISEIEGVTAIEAAIVPPEGKSRIFSVLDLGTLRVIARMCARPIIVKAQKRMGPGDLQSVLACGARGISVDPATVEPGVEAYRDAILTFRSQVISTAVSQPPNQQQQQQEAQLIQGA